ncbi:MAG TPA: amino acid adenylation domain-containing protein, partial [Longimicrobium sp.]|nr:amino acid adenylation domain-containing protein [Longimicrobium sp.]
MQVIAPAGAFPLPGHDLDGHPEAEAELRRLIIEEARAPFDLERGPLFRGRLVRLAADDHVLLLTMHHVVSDGWSLGVLIDELGTLYGAFRRGEPDPLPPLPVQYADYAAWQRRWVQGEVLEAQASYWTRRLAGAPELLELPTDRPRPARQEFAGASVRVLLDEELTAELRALGQRHGTTLFMTLMAGWATVLGRLAGQEDVVVGTPTANRGRSEVEGLIGFFVNTLPLRVELAGSPTVAELLGRVRTLSLEAQQNQDIPFEQVVERVQPARSLAHSPVFQALFAWQNTPRERLRLAGLELAPLPGGGPEAAKFDLSLSLAEADGQIRGGITYPTSLFDAATVERYVGYLRRVLQGMAADDARRVDQLPLLPDAERRQVLEAWNATGADQPSGPCVHQIFQAQAARTPDAVAVAQGDVALTYAELNARANRLARHLAKRGVGPDVRVGLCLERTPELVVGLMAILKAGGAYVPLDPEYPEERLRYMLADSRPAALLTQASLAGRFAEAQVPLVAVDADASAWADEPETDPEPGALTPDHLVYVIYTSGSTGQPKGTEVPHRAIPGFFRGVDYVRFDAGEVLLQHSSVSWDALTLELFPAILTGGRCVLYPGWTHDPAALAREIRAHGVTTMWISAALFNLILDTEPEMLAGVRQVMVGGEAVSAAHVRRALELYPGLRLVNGYGPSECTVFASCQVIAPDFDAPTVPIGRPVGDRRIYLLDRRMEPVPPGCVGELYVGGPAVARGYRGRPALTAERFVPDPFGAPGARLYRSGDRVRWKEVRECESARARKWEGGDDRAGEDASTHALTHSRTHALEFVERADHQVKVRGFRVELGEIEVQLSGHPEVRDVVVVAREDAPGDRRLVAYHAGGEPGADALRAFLSERLPEYMVPAAYVRLEALPLTPHGKVDRRALPAPEADAFAASAWVAPVGPVEEALAEIWAELLGVERVSRNDNFFRLGGHSLKAVRLIERMRRRGLHAEVGALFTTATLAELAASVGGESFEVRVPANGIAAGCDAVTPAMLPLVDLSQAEIDGIVAGVEGGARNLQDVYPLAPLQEGILFHHLKAVEGDPYLVATLSGFDTRERLDAYVAALQAVVDRHDILRTAVTWDGLREPVQVVWREARLPVEVVELDPAEGDVGRQLYARFTPRRHRIDVRRAPLVRLFAARDAERDRWLLLQLEHHLVSDHTTQDVLQEEIRAHLSGRADQLPAPMPFRNYVAQARLGVSRQEHEAYFRARLADVDEPTAPFGLLDVWGDGSGTAEARMPVDAGLSARLRAQARRLGVSAASVFHVAWAQVLGRASGREDVVFGTVLFGRMHGGDGSDRVMGPFINTLPVRVPLASSGVEEGVRGMHRQLTGLLRHEHASLALAQRCSGVAAPAPLFTSFLNFRHSQAAAVPADAARARTGIRRLHGEARSNYPVTLSVDDRGDGFALMAQVPASVGPERVCAMVHRALESLVDALETAPERPVSRVEVLPEAERAQVVDGWNATDAEYPADACVHELFEAQVMRTPDAVALVHEGGALTYAELNASANRLAHHLVRRGVGPDVPVGLCLERGPEMVVALLAVLKAGGAYVPLDPEYPEDRLRYMLADSAPAVLLTQSSLAGLFAGVEVPRISIDSDQAGWADEPGTDPSRGALTPEHLAYVIYTSGSTGQPKGVMNQHRTLVNRLVWGRAAWGIDTDEAVLCKTSLNFDGSVR